MSLEKIRSRLNFYIFSKKVIPFALFYLGFSFFVSIIFVSGFYLLKIFFSFLTHTEGPFKNPTSIAEKFLVGIIVAPLLETYIFQYSVFQILKGKTRDSFIILISALLFGLSHFYDLFYIIHAFLIGLILAIAYKNWQGDKMNKFWMLVIIHATMNFIALLASL